jgi:type VI secretion system secreted protein Hcp
MAADMFLKLDGIKGESKDQNHKGEIDIESFTFAVNNGGSFSSGGGGGAGKVSFSDMTFMKSADLSSPELMRVCAAGTHIAFALLTVRKAGGQQEEFYKIKLSDVLVSSVSNSGANGGNPQETLAINFAKIEFDYKEQTEKGTLAGNAKFGWDLKANVKV